MKVLFYISGHGLGHATRACAVMKALINKKPDIRIYARTKAPKRVFDDLPREQFQLDDVQIDVGVVEKDIFAQDVFATLNRYAEVEAGKECLINTEAAFIRQEGINVIVSDIPPLASEIGGKAKIPTIGIANFSWDFIYEPYVLQYPAFAFLIDKIRSAYEKTTLLLRLPLHHEMTAFPRQSDIPFATRHSDTDPQKTLVRLGIDPNCRKRIILLALRMDNVVPRRALQELVDSRDFLILSLVPLPFDHDDSVRVIGREWRGPEFPDLLAVSNLVIAKLGYGIISESIASRVPLMYVPRDDFREYEVLRSGSADLLPSYLMPRDDFLQGRWREHINSFLSNQFSWPSVRTNGADIAAEIIISHAA
jgi:hypothetical protein